MCHDDDRDNEARVRPARSEPATYHCPMVRAEDDIIERMENQSGGCRFVLPGTEDSALARAAMQSASAAVFKVPHPDEPDDPLPKYASGVTEMADGPSFLIDCKDMLDDPDTAQAVVDAMLGALNEAGANGVLCVIRHDDEMSSE